ncbi:MAG TPA: magnesium transporter [Acidimicrobiia bacterium]
MRFRLHRPRELARQLRTVARRRPEDVEIYLGRHEEEWASLAEAMPGDAADILEAISEEAAGELIVELAPEDAADVLGELRDDLAAELLLELPIATVAAFLEEMPPEEAVDILEELDEDEREPLIAAVSDESEAEIRRLLAYPSDSAGGLMTTEIAALPIGMTAGEAIERLRHLHEELEELSYVYIVDDLGRLKGVLSFRDLVFNRPGVGLDEAMVASPLAVTTDTDREVVADMVQRYHLFGLPVVDDSGTLLGMVTSDAVIEAVQQEASEDFAAAVGAGVEETVYSEISQSVRGRLPWLTLNLVLALGVAFVIEHQTGVIERVPVLAALMPVVALLGGNGGSQSLAVVIRSLSSDDIPSSRVAGILGRQASIGLMNGLALAGIAAILTLGLISGGIFASTVPASKVAVVIAIAALVNLTIATFAGSAIPLMLRRFGLDPALASSIFLTLVTDLVGFGGFLLVASLLM